MRGTRASTGPQDRPRWGTRPAVPVPRARLPGGPPGLFRQVVRRNVAQQRLVVVALGGLQLETLGPFDADVRVLVGDAAVALGVVVVVLEVDDVGDLAEDDEAVREAGGHEELVVV